MQNNGYLGNKLDLTWFADSMNFCSIILTFIFLTIPLIISEIKCQEYEKQRDSLIKNNKEIFEMTVKNVLNLRYCRLNVRIFVPKISLLNKIRKKLGLNYKLEYCIQNVSGLADKDITEELSFEVQPSSQGLVGLCYEQKAILYDDNLEESNEVNYNLSGQQIAKTNTLKFSLVCPLFSVNDEVVSIVAIDSCDEIKIEDNLKNNFRTLVLNYTQSLYGCVPELFKAKGGGIL